MDMVRLLIVSALVLIFFSGCETSPVGEGRSPITLKIAAEGNGQPFRLGDVYHSPQGFRYRLETYRSYISMIELVREDGSAELLRDFSLVDFDEGMELRMNVPSGHYDSIRFVLGVPVAYNKHVDPSQYANSHVLSVQGSEGMFWYWNSGYIFVKFDGKADLEGLEGNALLEPYAFHCGDDPLVRTLSFPLENTWFPRGRQREITLVTQVEKCLDGDDPIDLNVDFITHTTGDFALARRFMDNFAGSFILRE